MKEKFDKENCQILNTKYIVIPGQIHLKETYCIINFIPLIEAKFCNILFHLKLLLRFPY